jgi:hypothetical protein
LHYMRGAGPKWHAKHDRPLGRVSPAPRLASHPRPVHPTALLKSQENPTPPPICHLRQG